MLLMKLPHTVSGFISHSTNVITTLLRVSLQRERNFKEHVAYVFIKIPSDEHFRGKNSRWEQPRSNFSAVEIIIKNTTGGLGTKGIKGMFEGGVSTYIQPGRLVYMEHSNIPSFRS